jgi:hypothetical protein
MPFAHHPVFKQSSDPEASIWRYMDFTKFVSLLETSALFFSRADLLGDPFEGSYSRENERMRPLVYQALSSEEIANLSAHLSAIGRWIRQWTFINCWHMNAHESAGMWKLYAKTNEAIAIKSSFSRLTNELDGQIYLGLVEYIDFQQDWLPEGNTLYPYVHKRLSFEHEHEVRAVIQICPLRVMKLISRRYLPGEGCNIK